MIDSERKIMAGWSQLSSETKHSKKKKKKKKKKQKTKTINCPKAGALNNWIWVCLWSIHNLAGASDVLIDSSTAMLLRERQSSMDSEVRQLQGLNHLSIRSIS